MNTLAQLPVKNTAQKLIDDSSHYLCNTRDYKYSVFQNAIYTFNV